MTMFFIVLYAMITRRYNKPSWALQCCKSNLKGYGGPNGFICHALEGVKGADPKAVVRAAKIVRQRIHPHLILRNHLDVQELSIQSSEYIKLRNKWLNDLILDLRADGL